MTHVVIDSRAEYVDDHGDSTHVASCDIYEFIDGSIAAITSYTIEVPPGHETLRFQSGMLP